MSLGGKNEKNAFSGLLFRFFVLQYNAYLPVAQLDSASDSDSEGRRFESCRVGQKSRRPLAERLLFWSTRGEPVASAVQVRMPPCEGRHHERSELPCRGEATHWRTCRESDAGSDTPQGGITSGASYPVGAIKTHAKGAYKTPTRVSFSMQNRGKLPFS